MVRRSSSGLRSSRWTKAVALMCATGSVWHAYMLAIMVTAVQLQGHAYACHQHLAAACMLAVTAALHLELLSAAVL